MIKTPAEIRAENRDRKRKSRARIKERLAAEAVLPPFMWHQFFTDVVAELFGLPPLPPLSRIAFPYPIGNETDVWTNRSGRKFYSCCGGIKTDKNGSGSHCRRCRSEAAKEYHKSDKGTSVRIAYLVQKGALTGKTLYASILATLRQLTEEECKRHAETKRVLAEWEKASQKPRGYSTAFFGKIFQTVICVDCGLEFEHLWPKSEKNPSGAERCKPCQKQRNLKNHGGGPRRRCKYFGAPYEILSPIKIFNDEGWICHLCGLTIDRQLLGNFRHPMSPTMDHEWPLSVVIDGYKSPGHVRVNVKAAHLTCNSKKKNKVTPEEAKVLLAKFMPLVKNSPGFVTSSILVKCDVCGTKFVTEILNQKRCSSECRAVVEKRVQNKRRNIRRAKQRKEQV